MCGVSVCLWEVVTNGELPYNEYPSTALLLVAMGKKKLVLEIPHLAPLILAKVIELCMNRDPEERPNFSQLSEILSTEETPGQPILATTPRLVDKIPYLQ
jgi:hypothetical protein